MRKKAIFFIIQIFLLIVLESICSARSWYVRPSGRNGDGRSYYTAWSGFGSIIWSNINPGDVLYIAGAFSQTLTVGTSGTAAGLITVRGDLSGRPGSIDVTSGDAINMNYRTYVALDGIAINGSGANGVSMQQSSNCEVRNCKFYNIGRGGGTVFGIDGRYSQGNYVYNCRMTNEKGAFPAAGIVTGLGLQGALAPFTIDKCYIYGIDGDGIVTGNDTAVSRCEIGGLTSLAAHADGIAVQGSRVTVRQNKIYDCTQAVYPNSFDYGPGAVSACDDVTIVDNLIYQTAAIAHMNAINCDVETGGGATMKRLKIYNNTIAGVDQYGIQVQNRVADGIALDGLELYNNIVVDCGTYTSTGDISISISIAANGTIPNLKIDYNLVGEFQQARPSYRYQGADLTQEQMRALGYELNGKEAYPLFTRYVYQASGNDFTLLAGSPAIGMGLNLGSLYNYDINGDPRAASGPWDAGCYAYKPACSFALSPDSASFNRFAHSGSFKIATDSGCKWKAVSGNSWIRITSRPSGTGPATVQYYITRNYGAARTGTITVDGVKFTITQAGSGSRSLLYGIFADWF